MQTMSENSETIPDTFLEVRQMMKVLSSTILFNLFKFDGVTPKFHLSIRMAVIFLHTTCIFYVLHHKKSLMFRVKGRQWRKIRSFVKKHLGSQAEEGYIKVYQKNSSSNLNQMPHIYEE